MHTKEDVCAPAFVLLLRLLLFGRLREPMRLCCDRARERIRDDDDGNGDDEEVEGVQSDF